MEVRRGAQKCATCQNFSGTLVNTEGALERRNHLSPDWRRIWRIQVRLDGAFFGATRCSRNKTIRKIDHLFSEFECTPLTGVNSRIILSTTASVNAPNPCRPSQVIWLSEATRTPVAGSSAAIDSAHCDRIIDMRSYRSCTQQVLSRLKPATMSGWVSEDSTLQWRSLSGKCSIAAKF
jgi:hypothetical protein